MNYHHTSNRISALEWELQPLRPTTRETFTGKIERLNMGGRYKRSDGTPMSGEEIFDKIWGKDVPAWSLSRLLEIIPTSIEVDGIGLLGHVAFIEILYNDDGITILYSVPGLTTLYGIRSKNIYDAIIEMIEWLVEHGFFNKKYLRI